MKESKLKNAQLKLISEIDRLVAEFISNELSKIDLNNVVHNSEEDLRYIALCQLSDALSAKYDDLPF